MNVITNFGPFIIHLQSQGVRSNHPLVFSQKKKKKKERRKIVMCLDGPNLVQIHQVFFFYPIHQKSSGSTDGRPRVTSTGFTR